MKITLQIKELDSKVRKIKESNSLLECVQGIDDYYLFVKNDPVVGQYLALLKDEYISYAKDIRSEYINVIEVLSSKTLELIRINTENDTRITKSGGDRLRDSFIFRKYKLLGTYAIPADYIFDIQFTYKLYKRILLKTIKSSGLKEKIKKSVISENFYESKIKLLKSGKVDSTALMIQPVISRAIDFYHLKQSEFVQRPYMAYLMIIIGQLALYRNVLVKDDILFTGRGDELLREIRKCLTGGRREMDRVFRICNVFISSLEIINSYLVAKLKTPTPIVNAPQDECIERGGIKVWQKGQRLQYKFNPAVPINSKERCIVFLISLMKTTEVREHQEIAKIVNLYLGSEYENYQPDVGSSIKYIKRELKEILVNRAGMLKKDFDSKIDNIRGVGYIFRD